jgi:hypothetical protein
MRMWQKLYPNTKSWQTHQISTIKNKSKFTFIKFFSKKQYMKSIYFFMPHMMTVAWKTGPDWVEGACVLGRWGNGEVGKYSAITVYTCT